MSLPFLLSGNAKIFHRMGYFKDQEGIIRRYLRETEAWRLHLESTKAFMLTSSENKDKNKAAILGSGWLLDIPIEELSRLFREVWLFDIKHPLQIKRRVEPLKNVKLLETDISGLAIPLYNEIKAHRKNVLGFDFHNIRPQFDFDLSGFSYIVSCNMLNQLDIILLDYLKKSLVIPAELDPKIRRLIQDSHLHMLPKSKSCLVTDVEELWADKNNCIQKRHSLVYTQHLPLNPSKKWTWHFDNHYTYQDDYKTWFEVHAFDM
jgi:hypothetical protein